MKEIRTLLRCRNNNPKMQDYQITSRLTKACLREEAEKENKCGGANQGNGNGIELEICHKAISGMIGYKLWFTILNFLPFYIGFMQMLDMDAPV